jgi:hypothetical protein
VEVESAGVDVDVKVDAEVSSGGLDWRRDEENAREDK